MMDFFSNLWDAIVSLWHVLLFFLKEPLSLILAIPVVILFVKMWKHHNKHFGSDWD